VGTIRRALFKLKVGDPVERVSFPVTQTVWRTPSKVFEKVGGPGGVVVTTVVVVVKEICGEVGEAVTTTIVEEVVREICGEVVEAISVEVRMDVRKTTLVETTGGATVVGARLLVEFGKSKVAKMRKVVVATVVGMVVVIVGTTDGEEVVM
jgi:hypothetical protein